MSNTDYYSLLRITAFNDLANRAKPGIFIYAIVWFAIAFALDLLEASPTFFYVNSGLIVIFVLTRLLHLKLRHGVDKKNVGLFENWLIATVLLGALHWGLMSAWVFYDPGLSSAHAPILIVLAAFAMGGTSTLSISRTIRIYYPILLFVPCAIVFFLSGDTNNYLYGGLVFASWAYISVASASSEQDYWQAISNNLIAEERAKELEKLSVTDPLTQLKNRMYFDAEFEKEWQRASRLNSCISILMIDLDLFKQINDNYGHLFGDEVLREVSSSLATNVMRPADVVARYGGEEFIVLLPNTDKNGARTIAERIIKSVSELPFEHENVSVKITCSIGSATAFPATSGDRQELIKRADSALYTAKEDGRNRLIMDEQESQEGGAAPDAIPGSGAR